MFEVTVSANSLEELAGKINVVAKQFETTRMNEEPVKVTYKYADKPNGEVKEETKPIKKATPVKTKPPIKVEVSETSEDETIIDKKTVMESLQAVNSKVNLEKARECLAKFKSANGVACMRMSDIRESDYQAFIKVCNDAIAAASLA